MWTEIGLAAPRQKLIVGMIKLVKIAKIPEDHGAKQEYTQSHEIGMLP